MQVSVNILVLILNREDLISTDTFLVGSNGNVAVARAFLGVAFKFPKVNFLNTSLILFIRLLSELFFWGVFLESNDSKEFI